MTTLSRTVVAVAALVAMADLAQGATAGHMLKSADPVIVKDDDIVTGSISKPTPTASAKKRGAGQSDITGSIKPKPKPKSAQ